MTHVERYLRAVKESKRANTELTKADQMLRQSLPARLRTRSPKTVFAVALAIYQSHQKITYFQMDVTLHYPRTPRFLDPAEA